jgi:hypothetical protein
MARGHLKWSVERLATDAGIGASTVKRMEATDGVPSASAQNLDAIQRTLESAGVTFIAENGGGPGVRLRKG